MNPEVKRRWVAALRSGDYKQGRDRLQRITKEGPEFCCLGVLCEVLKEEAGCSVRLDGQRNVMRYGRDNLEEHSSASYPPDCILKAAEIDERKFYVEHNGEMKSFVVLNDDEELTFSEIADLIEAQL